MAEAKKQKKSRWRRRALIGLGVVGVGVPALWYAIHEVPGVGPAVADGVRAVLGPGVVAWAEDTAYDLQDRYDRWRYQDAKPKTFWEAPSSSATAPPPASAAPPPASAAPSTAPSDAPTAAPSAAPAAPSAEDAFPPSAFTPPIPAVASDGDGTWIAVKDESAGGQPLVMYKSLVHPDPKRNFAAVAVVAIDLKRVDLHLVAGSQEPASDKVPAERRPGVVPKEALPDLLAAFNGGFKAIHGHWGMMLDGTTFVVPRDVGCTVSMYKDGVIRIRSWPAVKDDEQKLAFYRQTPPCLVEQGKINNTLETTEYSKNWGATVSGDTVIRRSSIGIDKSGRVLFYGLGEAVTAQALSRAMRAVGAEDAAQLDVNYSYPRFLFFTRGTGEEVPHVASPIIPGIKYQRTEYVGGAEVRDFFYLTRRRTSS
ncbi:Cobalt-zinc-cadmium resistance protein [Minicystis rosea]|nr:Cobalt-zinc-cadmium resistance protein [Minicystis rosea]